MNRGSQRNPSNWRLSSCLPSAPGVPSDSRFVWACLYLHVLALPPSSSARASTTSCTWKRALGSGSVQLGPRNRHVRIVLFFLPGRREFQSPTSMSHLYRRHPVRQSLVAHLSIHLAHAKSNSNVESLLLFFLSLDQHAILMTRWLFGRCV